MAHRLKILLLLLAFVAVQVVDIANPDANRAVASEVHANLGIDFEGGGAGHDNPGHDIHGGCDIFHHLSPTATGSMAIANGRSGAIWARSSERVHSLAEGPPVPPPLV